MKCRVLVMVILMLVLLMGVGMAKEANWVLVEESDFYNDHLKTTFHNQQYLDTNNITKVQIGINEVIKAKIKVLNQIPNKYTVYQYWVNSDTRQWKLVFYDEYVNDKLNEQRDFRDLSWDNYDPNNKIINAILERS